MKNKTLYLIAFIVLSILILGFYFVFNKANRVTEDNVQPSIIQEEVDAGIIDNNTVISTKKGTSCSKLAEGQATCIENIEKAINSANNSICNALTQETDRLICIKANIVETAVKDSDPTKCNNLEVEAEIENCKSQVFLSLAIRERNRNYCDNIDDSEIKSLCHNSTKSFK